MDYPNGFDISVMPEARQLAVSRAMAIWSCVAFLIVVMLCGFVLWAKQSLHIKPFLISIDSDGGEWTVVSEKSKRDEYKNWRLMQEAVAIKFATDWNQISLDDYQNEANWCACDPTKCDVFGTTCDICCSAATNLYNKFVTDVLPDYKEQYKLGEYRHIIADSIIAKPMRGLSESGGIWRIYAKVESSIYGTVDIEIYARIARAGDRGLRTLGYYVSEFNYFVTDE